MSKYEYYMQLDKWYQKQSFKYPRTENYVLRNVNLKFKIGEKLAVVGMNGRGKTTFIKLLCRLYDPTEGERLVVWRLFCSQKMEWNRNIKLPIIEKEFTLS